ncbi:hypothetical protein CI102_13034 [Trichoderma harzianum]|nr:hypothetical protein CI102_13034 [Trichoderma harzianum]
MKLGLLPTNGQNFDPLIHIDLSLCTVTMDSWATNASMRDYLSIEWNLVRELIRRVPLWHCFWRVDLSLGNTPWKGTWYQDATPIAPSPAFDIPLLSINRWIPGNGDTDDEPFRCGGCDRWFQSAGMLLRHYHNEHRLDGIEVLGLEEMEPEEGADIDAFWHSRFHKYKCETCDKRFVYPRDLEEHENSHLGMVPNVCEDCGKGFSFRSSLLRHKKTMGGACALKKKGDWICEYCGKDYTNKSNLARHQNGQCKADR